jgi:hypothetical protein
MDPEKLGSLIEQRLRTMGIICAALVGSVFIYAAIAWLLLAQGEIGPADGGGSQLPVLPYVLAALGFCALVAAPRISSLVLGSGGTNDENPEQTLQRYQTSVIAGFAVRESAAIFGLVATFLTGNMVWVAGLAIAASLTMVAAWPRKETVLSELETGPTPID